MYQAEAGDFSPASSMPRATSMCMRPTRARPPSTATTWPPAPSRALLANTPGYDLAGIPVQGSEALLGMRFETDARRTVWFDKTLDAVQVLIDALLPATVNVLSVAKRAETPFVLHGQFRRSRPAYSSLIPKRPAHACRQQPPGHRSPANVAQDPGALPGPRWPRHPGLPDPAQGTCRQEPAHGGHGACGGPWVRGGHWDWNRETQFLASRGYAVLEPDYRGSTGYGDAQRKAGWKQWGLKMQDDIADGARWAIAKGYADPQRICIAGASYGGYSTLIMAERSRSVQVRHQLGGRDRHQHDARRALDGRFRPGRLLQEERHEGHGRRRRA